MGLGRPDAGSVSLCARIGAGGGATAILRKSMVNSIMPVGWPPLSETLAKVMAKQIPIFA